MYVFLYRFKSRALNNFEGAPNQRPRVMSSERDSFTISNDINIPVNNFDGTRVLGLFALSFPIVIFVDTLFEKKEFKKSVKQRPNFYEHHYGYPDVYSGYDEAYPNGYNRLPNKPSEVVYKEERHSTVYVNPYIDTYSHESSHFKPMEYLEREKYEPTSSSSEETKSHFKDNLNDNLIRKHNGDTKFHFKMFNNRREYTDNDYDKIGTYKENEFPINSHRVHRDYNSNPKSKERNRREIDVGEKNYEKEEIKIRKNRKTRQRNKSKITNNLATNRIELGGLR